jgi:hypothetical protein
MKAWPSAFADAILWLEKDAVWSHVFKDSVAPIEQFFSEAINQGAALVRRGAGQDR